MEDELNRDAWNSITQTVNTQKAANRTVCSKGIIRTELKGVLSNKARYKKRFGRDCLLSIIKYDKLISKNTVKTQAERIRKIINLMRPWVTLIKRPTDCA